MSIPYLIVGNAIRTIKVLLKVLMLAEESENIFGEGER